MGGYGSGRWGCSTKKNTVEDCLVLNINKLVRDLLLYSGLHAYGTLNWTNTATGEKVSSCGYEVNTLNPSASWLRVFYALTRIDEKVDYTIRLTTTKAHFGGSRWWYICPLVVNGRPCNDRVGKLYLPPGGKYYGCRICYNLTYTSCQGSHKYDSVFKMLAKDFPGITAGDIKRLLRRG